MSFASNKLFWLWLPAALLIVQGALEIILPDSARQMLVQEMGPYEIVQWVVMGAAFVAACLILLSMPIRQRPWLAAWVGIAALASLYITGEEISWGQHILQWSTPEYWAAFNDQNETNLHNTSSWLDQKPRLILEVGIIVGGIIVPLLRRFRPASLPARFSALYPSSHLVVVAGILLSLRLVDTVEELSGARFFQRISEIQEVYMFYFVLLYLLDFKSRLTTRN